MALTTQRADKPGIRLLLASLLYLGCILLFFYHNLPTLTTDLIGPPEDNMQDFWNTWYSQQLASFNVADWFYTRLLFFPEGVSLRYHSFSYPNLALIRLIRTLLHLPSSVPVLVGLHNSMLLASFYFAGVGAYYLAYHFSKHFWAAWVGGFIFAFSPFHFAHSLHHMHVASIQYIPVFVFCVLRLEETHRMRHGVGAVICFVLSALSSWYYLFYNLFFLFFLYLYRAIQTRQLLIRRLLFQSTAIAGGSVLLLSPLLVPMIREAFVNPQVYQGGHNRYVADLVGLFAFHPYHLAAHWTAWINRRLTGNPWEMSVYLGIVNAGLLLWAFLKQQHRRDPVLQWCLWGMLFFTLLAGGRVLHVLGVSIEPLFLPTAFLEHLPFLRNLRTPSRAIVYTYLFLGIGVARILNTLQTQQVSHPSRKHSSFNWDMIWGIAISVGLLLDFCSINRESTPVTCPPAYAAIGDDDTSLFGILDLPMTGGNGYMMNQRCHNRPIVHATISRKLTKTLSDFLSTWKLAEQKEELKGAHVKYIVVHTQLLPSAPLIDLAEYERHYRTVYRDANEIVFQVY